MAGKVVPRQEAIHPSAAVEKAAQFKREAKTPAGAASDGTAPKPQDHTPEQLAQGHRKLGTHRPGQR